ncbi:hypothetical protein [Nocardiopsis valliformis]|uniref:hypothetical protein n=1 Tax=Nocardiopsis valliformis TaxID=239974 RepID=UPI00034780FB|nr:hypothetical protein [Nocardiopsis valliformis]
MSAAKSKSSADRFAKAASSRRTAPAQATPEEAQPRPERGRTAVRSKPLRTTVDLSPADHKRLRRIADRLADDLDVGEVPRRAVWLALLAELAEDDALYERVRDRVKESRDDVDTA